jgi:glucose/arabinose dehydrogenase
LRRRALLTAASLAAASALAPPAPACAQPVIAPDSVPELDGVRITRMVGGLAYPWALAFLPDGSMLVSERAGALRRIVGGQREARAIEGLPQILAIGQGGLMDIALSPGFAADRTLFLSFVEGEPAANRTAIARARFDGQQVSEVAVIFRVEPVKQGGSHFGCRLLFLPDGTLLASIGDGGNPPMRIDGRLSREHAQNLGNHIGSIVRLNRDGSAPRDNPWVGTAGARPELFSVGHRNVQGLAWDGGRRLIWASEHGSSGGDELNLIQPGRNYGWPLVTHSVEYVTGAAISPHRTLPGMQDPVLVWQRAIAPSGLAVHSGRGHPAWRGDLFAGGLRSADVRRVRLDAEGRVTGQERIPIGARVRDVREGPDGALYVLTDSRDGALFRITAA